MKVSCLAHVLHQSAKAFHVSLDVTDKEKTDTDSLELDKGAPELQPTSASSDVAQTILKVCLRFSHYSKVK
jgi:hypothetical protein